MSTTNSLYVASKTYTNLPTSSLFVSQRHVVGVRHLEFTYLFQLMFRPMETKGHEDVEYALSVVGCSPMATQRVYHSLLRPPTLQPLLRCSSYHDSSAPTWYAHLRPITSCLSPSVLGIRGSSKLWPISCFGVPNADYGATSYEVRSG